MSFDGSAYTYEFDAYEDSEEEDGEEKDAGEDEDEEVDDDDGDDKEVAAEHKSEAEKAVGDMSSLADMLGISLDEAADLLEEARGDLERATDRHFG